MKKIFEYIGGFALIAFSFYFTDQVSLLVANKSDLMNQIKTASGEYNKDAIDAQIDVDNNTIIPGSYGKIVNNNESYLSMQQFGIFNENYLIYDEIKPKTSLEDNKDKYIIKGSSTKRNVSLIVDANDYAISLLKKSKINYSPVVNEYNSEIIDEDYINGAKDVDEFKKINSMKSEVKLCLKGYSNIESCLKYNYYIIKPILVLNSSNIREIKSHLSAGSIILISQSASSEHIDILLNEIKYKDLKIIKLSELINEKNSTE